LLRNSGLLELPLKKDIDFRRLFCKQDRVDHKCP
jgi:hypothetical protein